MLFAKSAVWNDKNKFLKNKNYLVQSIAHAYHDIHPSNSLFAMLSNLIIQQMNKKYNLIDS